MLHRKRSTSYFVQAALVAKLVAAGDLINDEAETPAP